MTTPTLQDISGLATAVVTLPLYLFVYKAGGAFKDVQRSLEANADAVKEVAKTLIGHATRISDLELERAREEGRRQGKPWDGRTERRKPGDDQ